MIKTHYKGFEVVANFYKNKHQGRAYYRTKIKNEFTNSKISAEGPDDESVINILRIKIDEWHNVNIDKLTKIQEENHKKFLDKRGFQYLGVRVASKKEHRITHCYNCYRLLDNSVHLECMACKWIICDCGACGCGWNRILI